MSRTGYQNITLVLGGARSGKSSYAEKLIIAAGTERVYVATAVQCDTEMGARIAAHRQRRGVGWTTVEAPRFGPKDVVALPAGQPVLFDCLTLWLAAAMEAEADWAAETTALIDALASHNAPVVMVSNELGMGLVPETPLGRRFRDAQGTVNQMVAAQASRVVFVAAGLPLSLKGAGPS